MGWKLFGMIFKFLIIYWMIETFGDRSEGLYIELKYGIK